MVVRLSFSLLALFFAGFCGVGHAQKSNVAVPDAHPYVHPSGGREGLRLADEPVNAFRVYDFYQRQADYYMAGAQRPEILPAYPGLDAGQHGHWGKFNQNNHKDGRWNDSDFGSVVGQVFVSGKTRVLKGIAVRLDAKGSLSTCFDPLALCYRSLWQDGHVRFHPFRWGSSRNATRDGEEWFVEPETKGWAGDAEAKYHGYYRHGDAIVFRYSIGETEILDHPSMLEIEGGRVFVRTLEFPKESAGLSLRTGRLPVQAEGVVWAVDAHGGEAAVRADLDGVLWLDTGKVEAGGRVVVTLWRGPEAALDKVPSALPTLPGSESLNQFLIGGKTRWPDRLASPGLLGRATGDSAYVVDTLPVPYDNAHKIVMQLSGIAFLPDGAALVSVLSGDVWKVSGISNSLEAVTWKRFATGLNQPIGIHIDEDGVFVLDRGQIYRLHDYDGDDEADFYENYANDFGGYDRSHTHTFGLARTADGAFTFVQREGIFRTSDERKTERIAWGVRNCMGVGGSSDRVYIAPQEGTWTPASMIIEVNPNEFYGLPVKGDQSPNIATPLCYIPRGVDSSTGGMVEVTSDRWGPFKDSFVGLSYGYGMHYVILRDGSGARPQGAVVPLEGEFLAGTMRGAYREQDGQLYVAGLDGWGDYSTKDGCLHRVRFTGAPVRKPNGFRIHENGIRIDFPMVLDAKAASEVASYFVHQWNYEYANRYGSPEFSAKVPSSLGHDAVEVRSAVVLNEGKSVFLEIPDLEPVMQVHVRMHLKDADGVEFKTDLFPSVLQLGERFDHEGFAAAVEGKVTAIAVRTRRKEKPQEGDTESGAADPDARVLVVNAIGGLQYEQKKLSAKPGESLALRLRNQDVMPHNLVIVNPGKAKVVGEKSFSMLNDPDAAKKHYVPGEEDIVAHTFVINPGTTHTTYFKAPTTPGDYPFICTFPGHWQAMRGVLQIEN